MAAPTMIPNHPALTLPAALVRVAPALVAVLVPLEVLDVDLVLVVVASVAVPGLVGATVAPARGAVD